MRHGDTISDMAARAGYWQRLDLPQLLADLRQYPGCDRLKPRTLHNYITGATKMPLRVALALSAVLGVPVEVLGGRHE